MSPSPSSGFAGRSGFPRVSGDEPLRARWYAARVLFSPRERG